MTTTLTVEKLSKRYRIRPNVGFGWHNNQGVLVDDIARFANRLRGKEVGEKKIDFWALKDVSFRAEAGDVIGLIGRNGAGKSTLLKILGRVTEPTAGQAVISGRVGSLLEVGTGFHSELTGRENIFISGAILGMSRAEIKRKFDEIVSFSGVESFLETPVKRFSSGMEVRLAFAVAAHLNPTVLLVDEVLAVGDAAFREKSLNKIKDVARNGGTILFVSHNMTIMSALCNKALVIDHGETTFPLGPVPDAVEYYLNMVKSSSAEGIAASRKGAAPGVIEITQFGPFTENNQVVEMLTTGAAHNFIIEYKKHSPEPLDNIEFEIHLKTLNGEVIAILNSSDFSEGQTITQDQGQIICRIDKLPLAPGTITASVRIVRNKKILDLVEDAFIGNVDSGGHLPRKSRHLQRSLIAIDQTWEFE